MEFEHVKESNELVRKTPDQVRKEDGTSFTEGKDQHVSPMELADDDHGDEKGLLRKELNVSSTALPLPSEEMATQKSLPEMKSPPIQVMGQPPGYDPNRIPVSIFSTKPGNATDWSATSNESLFSIHMGNNSFSRDYAILFGKSGELPKLEDWNGPHVSNNPFMISGELPRLDTLPQPNPKPGSKGKSNEFGNLPPVMEVSPHEECRQSSELPKVEKKDEDSTPRFVSGQSTEKEIPRVSGDVSKKPPLPETNSSPLSNPASPSPSRLSDDSGHSGSSFAFPVLASNDSGKNESVKAASEKPGKDEQPKTPNQAPMSKETPTSVSGGTRWFSCFSCWPRFC